MSLELISALASVGTFIVIGASAVAALVQLRHLQSSNQLHGMLALNDRWNGAELGKIVYYVRHELPKTMASAQYATSLLENERDQGKHPEIALCDLWEQVGTMVKHGFIKEDPFLDLAGIEVSSSWDALAPAIGILRRRRAGFEELSLYENFEYLAVRARDWQRVHPHGNYPKGVQRLSTSMPASNNAKPDSG